MTMMAKLILGGTSAYAIGSTFITGLQAFIHMAGQASDKMLFACENWQLYLAIVVAIAFVLFVDYFLEWQEYQKNHADSKEEFKFDIKYVVAAVCTMLVSAIISYLCVFYGVGYVAPETTINEPGLCFVIAFFVSGIITYVVDACIFKKVCDGTMSALKVKSQKAIREALASEEAKKKILEAVTEKAKTLGLIDEAKVAALAKMVDGPDDPSFALYVQLLLK